MTHPFIDDLIREHGLNRHCEKRPKLRKALNISQPTQWRYEKKLNESGTPLRPVGRLGGSDLYDTVEYLTRIMRFDEPEEETSEGAVA